jgi:hypothetical protein
MAWKVLIGAAALIAATSGSAWAQSAPVLPPDVAQAVKEWSVCRAQSVQSRIQSQTPASALAELSLADCKAGENQLLSAIAKIYGDQAGAIISRQREKFRADTIAFVDETRSGKPISDLATAFGICVGEHTRSEASRPDAPNVIADRALAACKSDGDRVLEKLKQQSGAADAARLFDQARQLMRQQAVAMIEQLRAGSNPPR